MDWIVGLETTNLITGRPMTVYLASPNCQLQAAAVRDMPVLLSFACWSDWLLNYQASFPKVLIDSGAFSELNSGKKIDLGAYRAWSEQWRGRADAIAGLDNIAGDWKRSLANYEAIPWGFPTFHEADPPELLPELVAMAQERDGWIGLGLTPPRTGKIDWVRKACDRIPEGLHVHCWAGREFFGVPALSSVDSTNWWRDALDLRKIPALRHLTPAEHLEIIIKRYQRETRVLEGKRSKDLTLWG